MKTARHALAAIGTRRLTRRLASVLISLICVASLAGPAFAQVGSLPSQPHLLVKGEATRTVVPDRFTVVVQLQAVDTSAERARQQVGRDAARILEVYRKHGAIKDQVQASGLSMQPQMSYEANREVFKGTRVERSLSATFDSLDKVRQSLAEIETSDSLRITGITTAFSGEATARAELKRQAAEQTRRSADQLAKAYGVRLSGLYTISDVAPQFAYGIQAGTWPQPQGFGTPPPAPPAPQADGGANVDALEAGEIVLSENVYAVFLIAQ